MKQIPLHVGLDNDGEKTFYTGHEPFLCAKYVYKFCRIKSNVGEQWRADLSKEELPGFIPVDIGYEENTCKSSPDVYIKVNTFYKSLYTCLQGYLCEYLDLKNTTGNAKLWVRFTKLS